MNIESLLQSIKNDKIASNYLVYGEESFFIDLIASSFIQYTIPDSEKVFNQKVFYGKEINVFSLISVLKSFPMMGERQLVVVREAHKLANIEELVNYLLRPIGTTVFVLCYKNKTIDKRKKWVKSFQKNGVVVESKLVYGQKISYWIQYQLTAKDIKIEKNAELLLIDSLGNNLSKITNAIDKLSNVIDGSVIQLVDVQEHIGVHREYNNFELQNALAEKDHVKIISIVNYFITNPRKFPLPPIIGVLFSFFSKLIIIHSLPNLSDRSIAEKIKVHPFFVSNYKKGCANYTFQDCIRIISLLKEADFKFKGIKGAADHEYLKELVLQILY